jgi:large subunit ribosomal protein L4
MTEVNIHNSKFESKEKLKLAVTLSSEEISVAAVHQVTNALLASRRQGNASTKTKAEVRGGGKKPFKQKGTGNARQGSKRSPLMPGGGVVFGPKPRSYEQKLNKKMVSKAIHSIVADKFQAGKLIVVDQFNFTGKTSEVFKALASKGLSNSLLVTEKEDSKTLLAARNLKTAKGIAVVGFSVYEALKYENLIIEKSALDALVRKMV